MKDAEYLRRVYNERFNEPLNRWSSENLNNCVKIAARIVKWTKLHPDKTKLLLDVGCATGYYTKAFSLIGFEAYGLDYSDVAIEKASKIHPECNFIHMDGFNPQIDLRFDLIFCKGFSGCNTHIISDVVKWSNKYTDLLLPGGKFVLSYSTDFSGTERDDETVNWTIDEIKEYRSQIHAGYSGMHFYYRYGFISKYLVKLKTIFAGKKVKQYFYLIFTKE